MTNKQRILKAIRGEMPDVIPFAPRLDLWYSAQTSLGGLPAAYRDCTQDEISRAEGWGLHKINPAYQDVRRREDHIHWGLGILSFKEMVFNYTLPPDVDVDIRHDNGRTRITYHTPRGDVSTCIVFTETMRRAGVTGFNIEEHPIKTAKDYAPLAHIFANLKLRPDWDDFVAWKRDIGEDGLAFTMAGRAASPVHHIQKYFIDATEFFFHYKDHRREMTSLAESMAPFFDQTIDLIGRSPAEAVYWGANFDDMITYPAYFEADIMPWIRKAADTLGAQGIYISCHCDGENRGLMDLIRDSGMHVAEAVTPHPMTKVTMDEYYARWGRTLTIYGGIPSILLLEESTSDEEFDAYMTHLFKAVAPGRRMIFGIADSVPPNAVFDRIRRIGQRIAEEARLPIEAGGFNPVFAPADEAAAPPTAFSFAQGFESVQADVLTGDHRAITQHVKELLQSGVDAGDILKKGMLPAMEVIGERFRSGEAFIPEVLMSARAMNEATATLEPFLSKDTMRRGGKVLIGTVRGDLHDIGKNIVATMLRGVGFEIRDLGINVPAKEFLKQVQEYRPDVLALSALLTTTMPEMKSIIRQLAESGLRDGVKVIVGGAPLNERFAHDIGADGYARDAGSAVTLVKRLMQPG